MSKELIDKEYWKNELVEAQNRVLGSYRAAATDFIEFSKAVYDYKQECAPVKGGSSFSKDVKDWIGLSQPSASKLCSIGAAYDSIAPFKNKLPTSRNALVELSKLDSDLIRKAVNSNTINAMSTAIDITNYKHDLEVAEKQKESAIVNELKKQEESEIESNELLDDFELVGIDENGNEIWETKSSGVSEVKVEEQNIEPDFDRDGCVNSIMQFIMRMSNKLNDDDLQDFEEYVRNY